MVGHGTWRLFLLFNYWILLTRAKSYSLDFFSCPTSPTVKGKTVFFSVNSSNQTKLTDKKRFRQFPLMTSRTVKCWRLVVISVVCKLIVDWAGKGIMSFVCMTKFLLSMGRLVNVFLHPWDLQGDFIHLPALSRHSTRCRVTVLHVIHSAAMPAGALEMIHSAGNRL